MLSILPELLANGPRGPELEALTEPVSLSEVETVTLKLDGAETLMIKLPILAVALMLTACTQYRYVDPQTPEGLDCLRKLDARVNACETDVKAQQDNFDSLHETQARSTQQCEHFNTLNMPNACPPPPPPTQVPNYCRSGYKEKYVACGGRIEKVEK